MENIAIAQELFELGLTAMNEQRFGDAEQSFRRSLQHCPERISTKLNLATALIHQQSEVEALELIKTLLCSVPTNPHVHRLLGVIQSKMGKLSEAIASFEAALALEPDNVSVLNNLAVLQLDAGACESAKELFEKAVALQPDFVDAYVGLGQVYRRLNDYTMSIKNLRHALLLRPKQAEAHMSIANVYFAMGKCDAAFEHYMQAWQINPDLPYLLGTILYTKARMCMWKGKPDLELLKSRIIDGAQYLVPPFAALSIIDAPDLLAFVTNSFIEKKYLSCDALGPCLPRVDTAVINVAYYSSDFRTHPVAQLICRVLELHSRNSFKVHAFAIGPDLTDELTLRIGRAVDVFIDVRDQSDIEIARLSRAMKIDIAIDLNGFTENNRAGIFSYRCAPVQVNYLGYPHTMGFTFYDYIIGDKIVIPETMRKYYSERVVWLPGCYQPNDPTKVIAGDPGCREDFGLPPDCFVFCCFNNSQKIRAETFKIWMNILSAVPGSVLWLLKENEQMVVNLRSAAEDFGVASSRIIFAERLPLDRHLARHVFADLFLDTLPYNAHTTASDALWAGLPVLTCIGSLFPGRVAASLLKAMSLDILITTNPTEYETAAIHWARNPMLLQSLRQSLARRRRSSALFDARRFTHHLEVAYACMQDRVKSGLPPAGFAVLSEGGVSVLPSDG